MIGLRIKHGRKVLLRLHTAVLRGDLQKLGTLVRRQFSVEAVVATYGLLFFFFYQGLARIPVLLRANRRGRFIKADGRFIKAASLNCSFFQQWPLYQRQGPGQWPQLPAKLQISGFGAGVAIFTISRRKNLSTAGKTKFCSSCQLPNLLDFRARIAFLQFPV